MLSASEQAAADHIIARLKRHTLAIKLTGAYVSDTHRSFEQAASELDARESEQAAAFGADDNRRMVYVAWLQSIQHLAPDAVATFALVAAFASADVGRNALIEAARHVAIERPEVQVDALVRRALVDERLLSQYPINVDRSRVVLHPMLRSFAEGLLREWDDTRRDAACRAVATFYADYCMSTSDRWLAADEANIIGALEWSWTAQQHDLVATLCDGMHTYWRERGRLRLLKQYLVWGITSANILADASRSTEDRARAARLAVSYGHALKMSGELKQAAEIYEENLKVRRAIGDRKGEGVVLSALGGIAQTTGDILRAEECFRAALQINEREGVIQGCAANLMYLGQIAQARGQLSEAERLFNQALGRFKQAQDTHGEGANLAQLAKVFQGRGQSQEAEELLMQSLAIRRENGDLSGEAAVLSALGQLSMARGDLRQAESNLSTSHALHIEVGDRIGEAGDLSQLGRLALVRGRFRDSMDRFNESLAIFRELRIRPDEGVVVSQLGLVAIERGELDTAAQLLEQSLAIRVEVQDLRGKGVDLALLGRIALEQGEYGRARSLYRRSMQIARKVQNTRGMGVNLRQLGVICERTGHPWRAEILYRRSLAIAQSVENRIDEADATLELGRFLCDRQRADEGCPMLNDAVRLCVSLGLPQQERAFAIARGSGCPEPGGQTTS